MSGEVSIEHVVGDIDGPVREPPREREVVGEEGGFRESKPAHFPRLLLPELLTQLWGARPSVRFFVGVLSHEIKFINAAPHST